MQELKNNEVNIKKVLKSLEQVLGVPYCRGRRILKKLLTFSGLNLCHGL